MSLVRVMTNINIPSYHPMQEGIGLNATVNIGAPFFASFTAVHSTPICSALVKSGIKGPHRRLDIGFDANALS